MRITQLLRLELYCDKEENILTSADKIEYEGKFES
jgi:hypothetical protein